jgi:hypothetical protein
MRYKLTLVRTVYQIAEVHVEADTEEDALHVKYPIPVDDEWQVSEYLETDVVAVDPDPIT